jgi:hypothetical protein
MAPEVLRCPLKRTPEVRGRGLELEPCPGRQACAPCSNPSALKLLRGSVSRAQENKGRAELAYSEAVDAWAAGVLAYELLVGQ